MAIEAMPLVMLLGAGIVGAVLGLAGALYVTHKGKFKPPAEIRDVWKHIEEATLERAQVKAKRKALHETYKRRGMPEATFVHKDAHYEELERQADEKIDYYIGILSQKYMPEEEKERGESLRNLGDMVLVAEKIKALQRQRNDLKSKADTLHVQLSEHEEDKKRGAVDRAELAVKLKERERQVKSISTQIEKLAKQRGKLNKKLDRMEEPDVQRDNLKRQGTMMGQALAKARERELEARRSLSVISIVHDRYAKYIDAHEHKTVQQLKEMVQPKNPEVLSLVKKYDTAQRAYKYVRDSITETHVEGTFWLSLGEVIRIEAADNQDRAILLCSMLRALGSEASVAVLELKNGDQRAVVLMPDRLLDPVPLRKFGDGIGEGRERIEGYSYHGHRVRKVLYEFNDREYKGG